MLNRKPSQQLISAKNKIKPIDHMRRTIKNSSKCSEAYRKIPKVIGDLQKNINLLKKYYEEEQNYHLTHQKMPNTSSRHRLTRPKSSGIKKNKKIQEEETTMVPQLQDVKRSFLTVNGYDSNNVVELYNFYKKNMEKSTRIFGSISGVNSTHNYSDCRDNKRPMSALIVDTNTQDAISRDTHYEKQREEIGTNLMKNNSELVNVANLLADRKKISRENICNTMNSNTLYSQAKRKLMRPNTMENIERVNINQQNKRTENIRISPAKKLSKEKMSGTKEKEQHKKGGSDKKNSQKGSAQKTPIDNKNKQISEVKLFSPLIKEWSGQKCSSKHKQQKQGRSGKSIKSGKSLRSPSLNKGLIFQIQEFSPLHMKKKEGFKKAKTSQLTDSLLDCEISMKQNSRNLDLESVPFQF